MPHEVWLPWTPAKLVERRASKEVTNGPESDRLRASSRPSRRQSATPPAELKNVIVNLVCERASKEEQLECELAITTRAREPAATSRWVASMPSSRGIRTSIRITSLPVWKRVGGAGDAEALHAAATVWMGRRRRRAPALAGRGRGSRPGAATAALVCLHLAAGVVLHPHPAKDRGWAA
jgi:hypothetical protein